MKVLVTYYSQSGNTEKIAKAIQAQATALDHDTDLIPLENAANDSLSGYEVIFIGSPLHSGTLAAPVKKWLEALEVGDNQKMAGFITHFAPGYPDQDMNGFTEPIKAACAQTGMDYLGAFDCQGALTESLYDAVQKKMNQTDEQWAETVKQMLPHPDQEDEKKAKSFAEKVLS